MTSIRMASQEIQLYIVSEKKTVKSTNRPLTIGRGQNCDIPLGAEKRMIARIHARFEYWNDGWYIEDMQSTNGTWLNGERLTPGERYRLSPNAVIDLAHQEKILYIEEIATFEEAENYINSTPRFTTKNSMEDTKAFLHKLGDPDKKMKIIHVAGTNGKGSVCAYMRSILEASGKKVAVFTSPHLVDIRERFVVGGEMISKEEFLEAFLTIYNMLEWEQPENDGEEADVQAKRSEKHLKAYHPTYFEYLFFIAMLVFSKKKPDYCILETGLGGRLDATNSVSKKELAVITHISLDHVEYLGDTVGKIAGEKAGIMQAGAPVVFWETCQETNDVFLRLSAELGISAHSVSENDYAFSNFKRKTIDFSVRTQYYNYISLTLHTIAGYQMENAALAVRAIEVLDGGRTITAEHIKVGIAGCLWAGRMEEVLPEVYVDGAHNEDGVRAFLETVAADGFEGSRSLLFSVVSDKDYERMVEELIETGLFDRIAVAGMHTGRALRVDNLKHLFENKMQERFGANHDCAFCVYDNVAFAFERMVQEQKSTERIYVAGSLYLVGEIKELLSDDKFRRRIEKISSQP